MFERVTRTERSIPVTVSALAGAIRSDRYKAKVEAIRAVNKDEAQELKKNTLPLVTPGGVFTSRRADALVVYSGLVAIDIDHEVSEAVYQALASDPHVMLAFRSPSGGSKFFVKVDSAPVLHKAAFDQIKDYLERRYAVVVDKSGSDICRACFVTWDPRAILNEAPEPYPVHEPTYKPRILTEAEAEGLGRCRSMNMAVQLSKNFASRKYGYHKGQRNNYIYIFACSMNRLGVPMERTLHYVLTNYKVDKAMATEYTTTIRSAYRHSHEFGATLVRSRGARLT